MLPKHLDTYVIGDILVIRPEIAIRKSTGEPVIYVELISRSDRAVMQSCVFETEEEYNQFVDQQISDLKEIDDAINKD